VKKDQRRNNRSVVQGYAVLRYYYGDVIHGPEAMVAEVLAVLAGLNGSGHASRQAGS
jgi:very-short-patch-repair endonuclease